MKKPTVMNTWQGRTIYDPKHTHDLNQMAAIKEFGQELNPKTQKPYTREEAEEAAYNHYRGEHLRRHAAHHVAGMKMAQAAGDMQSLYEHKLLYNEALKHLQQAHVEGGGQGEPYSANGPVPPDVAMYVSPNYSSLYKFKSHPADDLVLSGWKKPDTRVPEMAQTIYENPATKSEKITYLIAELKKMAQKL